LTPEFPSVTQSVADLLVAASARDHPGVPATTPAARVPLRKSRRESSDMGALLAGIVGSKLPEERA
jgi:hypothetical protein